MSKEKGKKFVWTNQGVPLVNPGAEQFLVPLGNLRGKHTATAALNNSCALIRDLLIIKYQLGMGLYSKALLFAFFNIFPAYGKNLCPVSYCGSLSIQYPFKLLNQTPTNNCTYFFDLTCNTTSRTTIVNLPHAGDFYVQDINYIGGYIQLSDPGNCLMGRLMNFSLESSLFRATRYSNYTYYVCPSTAQALYALVAPSIISCLSNSTNFTIAGDDLQSALMQVYGCKSIGSFLIPDPWPGGDRRVYGDLFLLWTWDDNGCKHCQKRDEKSGKQGTKPLAKIMAIAFSMPVLTIMAFSCCSAFCLHLVGMLGDKFGGDSATEAEAEAEAPTATVTPQTTIAITLPLPLTSSNIGLDESKIMACTEEVVFSENDETIANANSNTCSICLEIYQHEETIRLISKCGHCFHPSCIQQWLGKNSTCPVCRTSLSDIIAL